MNGLDANLGREEAKGFFMFLYSELKRHQGDIDKIRDRMKLVSEKYNFSDAERTNLLQKALDYVEF